MVELPPAKSIHLLRVLQTDITDGLAACRRRNRLPGQTCGLCRKPHQLYVFIDPGQENPSLAKPVFSVFADGYQRLIRFSNRGNIAKRVNFARLSRRGRQPVEKGGFSVGGWPWAVHTPATLTTPSSGLQGGLQSGLQLAQRFPPRAFPPLEHVVLELIDPLAVFRAGCQVFQFVRIGFEVVEILITPGSLGIVGQNALDT